MGVTNLHFIEEKAKQIIKKYKTDDPFKICTAMNIQYFIRDLHPEVKGIYHAFERNRHIFVNSNYTEIEQRGTCFHEIAHSIFHKDYNCMFFKTHTFFNLNKFEKEAELFAACSLIPDISAILELEGMSFQEIAYELNLPVRYIKLRVEHWKNYK